MKLAPAFSVCFFPVLCLSVHSLPIISGAAQRRGPLSKRSYLSSPRGVSRVVPHAGSSDAYSGVESARIGVAGTWGVLGVFAILFNGVKRLVPIAAEPFASGNFSPASWMCYASFAGFMAYAEGYKGFQTKFCPFVIKRARVLGETGNLLHKIFAAPFCMGLIHATRRRKILSWSLLVGIFGISQVAKRLSFPLNSIVDGGAVVGLSWGCLSLLRQYIHALRGGNIDVDAELPPRSQ